MAVELAKVSLWLHSFTVGAPLSFLDHHLRCGNSLIGITAKEAEASMLQEESGQLNLLTGPFVGLLGAAKIMRGISILNDATFAQVAESEHLFHQFDSQAKPYKRLLDVFVSQYFGVKQARNFLERYGVNIGGINWHKLPKQDQEILQQAEKLYQSKRFFHWDLEFPEVFIDLVNASWKENPGFDVVLGNPPYDELSEVALARKIDEKDYLESTPIYQEAITYRINLYRLFIACAVNKIKQGGYQGFIVPMSLLGDRFTFALRQKLLEETNFLFIEAFPQKDNPQKRVFIDAKLPTCVYILLKKSQEVFLRVRTHSGKYIEENSPFYLGKFSEIKIFDPENLSIPTISDQSWKLALKFSNNKKLCYLKNIASSQPGEIMINKQFQKFLSSNPPGEIILRGAHIGRYEFYNQPKQGTPVYLNKNLYLSEKGKTQNSKAYDHLKVRIGYQRGSAIDNYRRLICTIVQIGSFCSDTVGYFVDSQYNLYTLLALLNSQVFEWSFSLRSTTNHVNPYEIDTIRVPIINFTTPESDRLTYLTQLKETYQNRQDACTTITAEHIKCVRTDVIHDFLAYLAQTMIQLNQNKQTEMKNFLNWLNREIGADLDTLTNKTALKNYLGDYQKSEEHQTLEQFLDILKKNRKKLKIDPSARQFQTLLSKEYQTSLNTLLPIKHQLSYTDKLIDQLVYQLYGLTPEEIAIIEGKLSP